MVPSSVDAPSLQGLLPGIARQTALAVVVEEDALSWLSSLEERAEVLQAAEHRLQQGLAPRSESVDAFVQDDLPALRSLIDRQRPDVVALSPGVPGAVGLGELALSMAVPVLWLPSLRPTTFHRLAVPFVVGASGVVPTIVWLRSRVSPEQDLHVVQISTERAQPILKAEEARGLLDWQGPLHLHRLAPRLAQPLSDLEAYLSEQQIDILVVESMGISGLTMNLLRQSTQSMRAEYACSVLFLPGTTQAGLLDPSLDAPDLVGDPPLQGFVQLADAFSVAHRYEGEAVGLFARGASVGAVPTDRGRFILRASDSAPVLGLCRPGSDRVETVIRVLLPPEGEVVLLDASVESELLQGLKVDAEQVHLWGVRLSHHKTFRSLRERLSTFGVRAVLDAGVLLDDGHPDDLPDFAAEVRLERVARRLQAAGIRVSALAVIRDSELVLLSRPSAEGRDRFELLTGAAPDSLASFDFNIDNRQAREQLLALIDGAQRTVHLQAYIYEPDEVGRQVAAHLRAAAERGVQVRVLIDSLLSRHLSLGLRNPVLDELSAQAGATVRAVRPIPGVPGIEDLKQRDHRKALIADGSTALIGGRNIANAYYRGFDEVVLGPASSAAEVPWIDAGAIVSGACVRQLEVGFAEAWQASGGEALPAPPKVPAGPISARVVHHRGLVDANSVDAYRALFDEARERIMVVNTFPMQFELQESLRRACRRGVEVHYLVGNPRPYHGDHEFFDGWVARALATKIVFGRLDDLVAEGAHVYEAGYPRDASWAEEIEMLYPHVHAKLVVCDGRWLLIGSANVDITAGYWEHEASLLIDDSQVVGQTEAQLRALLKYARPLSTEEEIGPRRWLSQHWPSFLG